MVRSSRKPASRWIDAGHFVSKGQLASRRANGLLDTFDNAQVPIDGVTQYAERLLIGGAVVRSDRVCDAGEFKQNGALAQTVLIHLRRRPSREEAPAGVLKR